MSVWIDGCLISSILPRIYPLIWEIYIAPLQGNYSEAPLALQGYSIKRFLNSWMSGWRNG